MKKFGIPALFATLSGCIWLQTGFIRNESNATVFVGNPGGSSSAFSKIVPGQVSEARFAVCVEVAAGDDSRFYMVPQYPSRAPDFPNDAYQKGGFFGVADVNLVVTEDGLFYDSPSMGHVSVNEYTKNCSGQLP